MVEVDVQPSDQNPNINDDVYIRFTIVNVKDKPIVIAGIRDAVPPFFRIVATERGKVVGRNILLNEPLPPGEFIDFTIVAKPQRAGETQHAPAIKIKEENNEYIVWTRTITYYVSEGKRVSHKRYPSVKATLDIQVLRLINDKQVTMSLSETNYIVCQNTDNLRLNIRVTNLENEEILLERIKNIIPPDFFLNSIEPNNVMQNSKIENSDIRFSPQPIITPGDSLNIQIVISPKVIGNFLISPLLVVLWRGDKYVISTRTLGFRVEEC